MEFIDTVSIIHKNNNKEYEVTQVDGVYWYGDTQLSLSDHGVVRDDAISVFFPKAVVDSYDLEIYEKDHIVKGVVSEISSINELASYAHHITVLTVQENFVNSSIDNILVTGK